MMVDDIRVDPVEIAVEMLREELPGFDTRIDGGVQKVRIRGALPIAMQMDKETIYYAVPYPIDVNPSVIGKAIMDVLETDENRTIRLAAERAKERERVKRYVTPFVEHIVKSIREYGIEALNLEKYIEEREKRAGERGRQEGYTEGFKKGERAGRHKLMQELANALSATDFEFERRFREDDI